MYFVVYVDMCFHPMFAASLPILSFCTLQFISGNRVLFFSFRYNMGDGCGEGGGRRGGQLTAILAQIGHTVVILLSEGL